MTIAYILYKALFLYLLGKDYEIQHNKGDNYEQICTPQFFRNPTICGSKNVYETSKRENGREY